MSVTVIDRLLSFRKRWAGWRFDRLHGVETNREIKRADLAGMPEELRKDAGDYVPTHPALLRRIIRLSGIDPAGFTFIDLGCGKGRLLIAAAQFPFQAIVGIEADRALCEVAERNMEQWMQARGDRRLKVICACASEFDWPAGNLFVFMYSPFRGQVFRRVAAQLASAAAEPNRAVLVAYSADWEGDVLEESGQFTRMRVRRRQFWARSTVSLFYNDLAGQLRDRR